VEQRPIDIEEVLEGRFSEVGACGTAVVGDALLLSRPSHTYL